MYYLPFNLGNLPKFVLFVQSFVFTNNWTKELVDFPLGNALCTFPLAFVILVIKNNKYAMCPARGQMLCPFSHD